MSYEHSYAPPAQPRGTPPVRINLYSDTQSKPTPAMKAAMMEAEVGDEQAGTDPTINELCERMAAFLGKEAAVFMPSGTMCNQIAIITQCRPGDEILAHETAHILTSEGSGAAALAGAQITGLKGERGQFSLDTLKGAIRSKSRHSPPQRMVEVEQTANSGGGTVWKLDDLNAIADFAHEQGMVTHMDGARLTNATVAAGIAPSDMVAGYDTVWLDFTKGLGAPLGAVLAGSSAVIGQAWRWKQRMGGALRQGGICAAACLYSLDHHVERLAEDHTNAKALARGLAQIPGIVVEMPETNLVFFDTTGTGIDATTLNARCREFGVGFNINKQWRARACTHLDISAADIETAIQVIREVVAKGP